MKKIASVASVIGTLFYIGSAQSVSASYFLGSYYNSSDLEEMLTIGLVYWTIAIILIKILKRVFGKSNKLHLHGLVLSKYTAKSEGKSELSIQARKGGIWSFIMTKAKVDNKISVSLDDAGKNIVCEVYNLNGYNRTIINLNDISSFTFEYRRNLVLTAVIGIILFVILFIKAWVAVLGTAILAVWFFLSKSFILELETVGGTKLSFGFSTSVIEHLHMDKMKWQEIQDILIQAKDKK